MRLMQLIERAMAGAAIKDAETGKVYGPEYTHHCVRMNSMVDDFQQQPDGSYMDSEEYLDKLWDMMDDGRLVDGFMSDDGQFFTREQAAKAIKLDPTKGDSAAGHDPDRTWLDSLDLDTVDNTIHERNGVDQATSKTLYHGTTLEAGRKAMENGLEPTVGAFVQQMYGFEDGIEELVFFTDKKDISKAITAMGNHVARLLKKRPHTLTSKELYDNGALLVLRSGSEQVNHKVEDDWEDHPTQVEPDDYYTDEWMQPDYLLTGKKLRQFITRLGLSQNKPQVMHGDQQRNHRIRKGYEPVPEDTEQQHADALDATGYWGTAGAGCLIMAQDTRRILIPLRSEWVQEPGVYGVWGGAIDPNEDPLTAAVREVEEEAGYNGEVVEHRHLYTFRDKKFTFDTFIFRVPIEFEPKLNWETETATWITLKELKSLPLHHGLSDLLNNSNAYNRLMAYVEG